MAPPDSTPDLPLLEVLDAAPSRMVPADRVGAVGAVLLAKGLLTSASELESHADDEFVWGFHRAARYGGVRRVRNAFALTSAGERLLREHGIEASEAARRELRVLVARTPEELAAEARRVVAAPS